MFTESDRPRKAAKMRPNEANMTAPKPTLSAVLEKETRNRAWRAVRANKGAPGPDGRDIDHTMAHIRKHWESIEGKLRAGDYKPGPVRAVLTNRLIIEPTKLNRLRPAGLGQRPFLYQPGPTALDWKKTVKTRAESPFYHHAELRAGLQPLRIRCIHISWAVGPGWYGARPWRLSHSCPYNFETISVAFVIYLGIFLCFVERFARSLDFFEDRLALGFPLVAHRL
jgi:hypothetical protein